MSKKKGSEKKQLYCGNNARNPDVRSGKKQIGSRYECFRRGVGIGLGLPYDPNFSARFVPIDKRKIYCGKQDELPNGYDIMGNSSLCMRKGVGVGRSIKAKRQRQGKKVWKGKKGDPFKDKKGKKKKTKKKVQKKGKMSFGGLSY